MLFCDQGRTTPKKGNILESLTIIVYLLLFHSHILQVPAVPSQSPLSPLSHILPQSPTIPTTNPHFTLTLLCSHQLFTDLGCCSRMRVPAVRAVNWSRARSQPLHSASLHTRALVLVLVHKIQIQRQMHNHIDNDKQDKHSTYKSSDPRSMVGGMYKYMPPTIYFGSLDTNKWTLPGTSLHPCTMFILKVVQHKIQVHKIQQTQTCWWYPNGSILAQKAIQSL